MEKRTRNTLFNPFNAHLQEAINWEGNPFEKENTQVLEDIAGGFAIVVFNDDVNTFEHVIECLVKYCDHTPEQAEQCSLIIHFKGKCAVKHGSPRDLAPICDALCRKGLSASVEEA